jgi:hypothetical protein
VSGLESEQSGQRPDFEDVLRGVDYAEAAARAIHSRKDLDSAEDLEDVARAGEEVRELARAKAFAGEVEAGVELVASMSHGEVAVVLVEAARGRAEVGALDEARELFGRSYDALATLRRQLLEDGEQDDTWGHAAVGLALERLLKQEAEAGLSDMVLEQASRLPDQEAIKMLTELGGDRRLAGHADGERFLQAAEAMIAPDMPGWQQLIVRERLIVQRLKLQEYSAARALMDGPNVTIGFMARETLEEKIDCGERYGPAYGERARKCILDDSALEVIEQVRKGNVAGAARLADRDPVNLLVPLAVVAAERGLTEEAQGFRETMRRVAAERAWGDEGSRLLVDLIQTDLRAGALDEAALDFNSLMDIGTKFDIRNVASSIVQAQLAAGKALEAYQLGSKVGWDVGFKTMAFDRIDNAGVLVNGVGAVSVNFELIQLLAQQGYVAEAHAVEAALDYDVTGARLARLSGVLRGSVDQPRVLERLREVAGRLPHEPLDAEQDRSLNVGLLLEQCVDRPDRILALSRYVSSADEFVAICRRLDRVPEWSAQQKGEVMARLLSGINQWGMDEDWRHTLGARITQVEELALQRAQHRLGQGPLTKSEYERVKIRARRPLRENQERIERLRDKYIDEKTVVNLVKHGYGLADLVRYPWLAEEDMTLRSLFPVRGSEEAQAYWVAEHGFSLPDDFSKRSLGAIALQRLEAGLETSPHNATQWMRTFMVPDSAIDMAALKAALEQKDKEGLAKLKAVDLLAPSAELALFQGIWHDEYGFHKLPTRPERYMSMFSHPEWGMIYRAILETKQAGGNMAMFRQTAMGYYGELKRRISSGAVVYDVPSFEGYEQAVDEVAGVIGYKPSGEPKTLAARVKVVQQVAHARQAYVDDATAWLETNRNAPSDRLVLAWNNREAALRAGVPDRLGEIYTWAREHAMSQYIAAHTDKKGVINTSSLPSLTQLRGSGEAGNEKKIKLTVEELRGKYGPYLDALGQRYSPEQTVWAVAWVKKNLNTKADFPPAVVELEGGYRFEVIPKDDPRAFTVGFDTACCMTIGGASQECIEAALSDRRYGIGILYEPDREGPLAFALMYNNRPVAPDKLIYDSIEFNQGRDGERIVRLVRQGTAGYLDREHGGRRLPFFQVNVGTAYSKLSFGGMQEDVDRVPTPISGLYSDAERQMVLFELEQRPVPKREVVVRGAWGFETIAVEDAARVAAMERLIYPSNYLQGQEDLADDLTVDPEDNFSFVIWDEKSNEPAGYMIATRDEEEPETVYIGDLAIVPERQGGVLGLRAMEELFRRLEGSGVSKLSLEARASTSYKSLRSPGIIRWLGRMGWEVKETELMSGFYGGEDAYAVRLERGGLAA